jgi:hypothetical protein
MLREGVDLEDMDVTEAVRKLYPKRMVLFILIFLEYCLCSFLCNRSMYAHFSLSRGAVASVSRWFWGRFQEAGPQEERFWSLLVTLSLSRLK